MELQEVLVAVVVVLTFVQVVVSLYQYLGQDPPVGPRVLESERVHEDHRNIVVVS